MFPTSCGPSSLGKSGFRHSPQVQLPVPEQTSTAAGHWLRPRAAGASNGPKILNMQRSWHGTKGNQRITIAEGGFHLNHSLPSCAARWLLPCLLGPKLDKGHKLLSFPSRLPMSSLSNWTKVPVENKLVFLLEAKHFAGFTCRRGGADEAWESCQGPRATFPRQDTGPERRRKYGKPNAGKNTRTRRPSQMALPSFCLLLTHSQVR